MLLKTPAPTASRDNVWQHRVSMAMMTEKLSARFSPAESAAGPHTHTSNDTETGATDAAAPPPAPVRNSTHRRGERE